MDLINIKKNYLTNGFVILKNFFDKDDINKLERTIVELVNYHSKIEKLNNNLSVDEKVILLNNLRKSDKSKEDRIQIIYNIIRKLPQFNNLITNQKIIKVVKKLNGIDDKFKTPYLWEGFIRIDPPFDHDYELRWHQESYFTLPNSNSVQLWSPIINKVKKNSTGTVSIMKKSFLKGEIPHSIIKQNKNYISESISDDKIKKLKYNEKLIEISPCDVLLFNELLIHKTFPNLGNKVRFTMIANYSNPFISNFKFMNENEVVSYHKNRTDNAIKFQNYIQKYSLKGGIKNFN